jgi:hypothetical protein
VLPRYEIWFLLWPTSSNHGTTKNMVWQVQVFSFHGLRSWECKCSQWCSIHVKTILCHVGTSIYESGNIYFKCRQNCSVGHLPTFDLGNNSLSNWSVCHMLKGLKHHICGVGMWKKRCRLKFQERLTLRINQKRLIINYS